MTGEETRAASASLAADLSALPLKSPRDSAETTTPELKGVWFFSDGNPFTTTAVVSESFLFLAFANGRMTGVSMASFVATKPQMGEPAAGTSAEPAEAFLSTAPRRQFGPLLSSTSPEVSALTLFFLPSEVFLVFLGKTADGCLPCAAKSGEGVTGELAAGVVTAQPLAAFSLTASIVILPLGGRVFDFLCSGVLVFLVFMVGTLGLGGIIAGLGLLSRRLGAGLAEGGTGAASSLSSCSIIFAVSVVRLSFGILFALVLSMVGVIGMSLLHSGGATLEAAAEGRAAAYLEVAVASVSSIFLAPPACFGRSPKETVEPEVESSSLRVSSVTVMPDSLPSVSESDGQLLVPFSPPIMVTHATKKRIEVVFRNEFSFIRWSAWTSGVAYDRRAQLLLQACNSG
mmetsp:Transcript_32585/g.58331  ORF Transcript_32585/g.58331 Transcript_32585/m.58331 type:complete len:401 (-) Transcript_32585:365-1567(-)